MSIGSSVSYLESIRSPSPVFLSSSSASTPSISTQSVKQNRSLKTFLKLLKPSISKKRKKIHLKTSNSFTHQQQQQHPDDFISKRSIMRTSTKRRPITSGVLITNPLVKFTNVDDDSNTILYRNRITLTRKKLSQQSLKQTKLKGIKQIKAKRAFSMITPSTSNKFVFNKTPHTNILQQSINSKQACTNFTNNASKELTWYKLEELNRYYKILGNRFITSYFLFCFLALIICTLFEIFLFLLVVIII